jgi:hypothetical protein
MKDLGAGLGLLLLLLGGCSKAGKETAPPASAGPAARTVDSSIEDSGPGPGGEAQGKFWNRSFAGDGAGGFYGGRFGGHRNLRSCGGGRDTESAVTKGLVWLKNHQKPDGTWACRKFMMECKKGTCGGPGRADEYDLGVTGLAMLAFLGGAHTDRHGEFQKTMQAAFKGLKEWQGPDGCFGPKTEGGHWIYNHAICTMAAAEAYGLTGGSQALAPIAQKAVDFLVECRNPGYGWRYGRQPMENDSSCTGWAVLALHSAKVSGLKVPPEAFDGALQWFDKVTDEASCRTGYASRGDSGARLFEKSEKFQPSEAMTAVAMLSRFFLLGKPAAERKDVLRGGEILVEHPPLWDVAIGTIDFNYWLFGSLAAFQLGGKCWAEWSDPVKKALVPTQKQLGCEAGSWDPVDAWGAAGGRVYATAMCTLTLEVYYRYSRVLDGK